MVRRRTDLFLYHHELDYRIPSRLSSLRFPAGINPVCRKHLRDGLPSRRFVSSLIAHILGDMGQQRLSATWPDRRGDRGVRFQATR